MVFTTLSFLTLCSRISSGLTSNTGHRAKIFHLVDDPFHVEDLSDSYEFFQDGLLVISHDGYVIEVGDAEEMKVKHGRGGESGALTIVDHRPNWVIPGFLDSHVHASQIGLTAGYSDALLPWLRDIIFPGEVLYAAGCNNNLTTNVSEECSQKRTDYALEHSGAFLNLLLMSGTTTVAAFTTTYWETADALFQNAEKINMRIIAGKNGQDSTSFANALVNYYDTADEFYDSSSRLIEKWHEKPGTRISYCITIRFLLSSSEKQLERARQLIEEHPTVFVQTHLAESLDEVGQVQHKYRGLTYTEALEKAGLLTPRTLLGHSVHLTENDLGLLAMKESILVHCPSSNNFLGSGLFNLEASVVSNNKVSLGSDVGGGTKLNILNTMGAAYMVAKQHAEWIHKLFPTGNYPDINVTFFDHEAGVMRNQAIAYPQKGVKPNTWSLHPVMAYYLCTLGSARNLGFDDKIGNFGKGKEADFVVLKTRDLTYRQGFSKEEHEALFVFMMEGSNWNVAATFIMGNEVYNSTRGNLPFDWPDELAHCSLQ